MSMIVPDSMVEHQVGVYLRQRHEDYLKDAGLGYGAVKDLYLNPVEWWDGSLWNPLRDTSRDDERKKAFDRGTALHTFVLDGQKVYDRVYGVYPTKRTNPKALVTVQDLQDTCLRYRLSTAGQKPQLIDTLVRARVPVEILEVEQEKFRLSGRKAVDERDDFRIRLLHRMMMRTANELLLGDGEHVTIRDLLHGALTEVSVFWIDDAGIRQRARFDILKPNVTADLKSITQWKRSNFEKALLEEVIRRGYMIQASHYHEARHQLRKAVAEGRVFGGTKTERKKLDRIASSEAWAWSFLFAKMDGAPQVKGIVIRPEASNQFERAITQREQALANFIWHRDFHGGLDRPWFDPNVVWEPGEMDWPDFSVLGQ